VAASVLQLDIICCETNNHKRDLWIYWKPW